MTREHISRVPSGEQHEPSGMPRRPYEDRVRGVYALGEEVAAAKRGREIGPTHSGRKLNTR